MCAELGMPYVEPQGAEAAEESDAEADSGEDKTDDEAVRPS